jgi:hypothetical protein
MTTNESPSTVGAVPGAEVRSSDKPSSSTTKARRKCKLTERGQASTTFAIVEQGIYFGLINLSRDGRNWEAYGAFGDKLGCFKTQKEALAVINRAGQELLQARDLYERMTGGEK